MIRSILILLLCWILSSCNYNCKQDGIIVTRDVISAANNRNIDYCSLLGETLKNDSMSICKLLKLNLGDGEPSYDHATILVEVVSKLGEQRIINVVKNFNSTEKITVESELLAGLDYTSNEKFKGKQVKDVFPSLFSYLHYPLK